jgi:type II secretory pathway pseudopilin PulG
MKLQILNYKYQKSSDFQKVQNARYKVENLRAGFTLVELLVYMGLLSIVLVAMTTIFTTIIDTQLNAQTTSYVSQDGRYIYSRFIHDINNATSVQAPAGLGSTSASLVLTKDGTQVTYALSGNNLVMTDNTGSYTMNSFGTTISHVSFKRVGNTGIINPKDTFQISFTVSGNRPDSSPEVKDFQTTAGLR